MGVCLLFSACVDIEKYDNNPQGNFEALWKIMDEHYCFFEYKEVDWDEVYSQYSKQISNNMKNEDLFVLLSDMLRELKDGHVNLYSSFDVGRYWDWYENYPENYKQELIDKYLGTDYQIAGGARYKVLGDNIGYMRYADFSSSINDSNLDYIIKKFNSCDGMIIDVRNNDGGYLSYSEKIASRFIFTKTLTGYIQHKTGKGHNDFSEPYPQYLEPSSRLSFSGPVIVLTNRKCYSACNDFVNLMNYCPNVLILGDKTGGGSGLPFNSELPNGWGVRFSASPHFNAEMEQLELGIEPDISVDLQDTDASNGKDTLIETARNILKSKVF